MGKLLHLPQGPRWAAREGPPEGNRPDLEELAAALESVAEECGSAVVERREFRKAAGLGSEGEDLVLACGLACRLGLKLSCHGSALRFRKNPR